jgi:stress-induced morphogen
MTEAEVANLTAELERRFDARVEPEEVAPGRFRLDVVSPKFSQMPPLRRQDDVWEAVDQILSREQTLDISLILTYAPDEVEIVPKA